MNGIGGLHGAKTLFALLNSGLSVLLSTRSHHAEPNLLHHLTLLILVGDPSGDAHATAFGTCTPLCGLFNAVHT